MSLGASVYDYVQDQTAITNLIGDRFWPQIAKPTAEKPFAIYMRTSVKRSPHSGGSSGFVVTGFRIVCFADTYDGALTLADKFRLALDGKTGTVGTHTFRNCTLDDESDFIDTVNFGQNDAPHFVALEFTIIHRETPPTF